MRKLFRVYVRHGGESLRTHYVIAESYQDAAKLFETQPIASIELLGWSEGDDNIFVDE